MLSEVYLQFLDKRWWVLAIGGGVLILIAVLVFIFSSGGDSVERDQQRLKEIAILEEAITKYRQAAGKYPAALKDLVPKYIASVPKGFAKPDGACKIGGYQYKKFSSINTFELLFCLGQDTGNYKAGNHILTPYGIR